MIIQQLITGISIGSVYALLAVGYALVFSVFNFSNFGFGPVMMLGAFGALFAIERTHMALVPAILVALAVAGLISLLMEVTIYRPMRQKKALKVYLMIAALGINTCVPNFCIQLWGGAVRPFPSDWAKAVIRIGNVVIPRADVLAAVLSVIMLALLWCFLYKTKVGLGIRASAFDSNTAGLMGINVNRVAAVIFLLSGATAGLAGCFYGMKYSVYPNMGVVATKGFVSATVGGLGSLPGAVISGLLLGFLETVISAYVSTTYRDLVAYGLLVVVLIVKPNGLLGQGAYDKL
ncbi:MAG: branched-chain amino acid ABC transporter permease [Lachnospiraceae bacterium]|nr:branched-chain amino acid ABC transporter permease [Lachnospiraceae bacterium]